MAFLNLGISSLTHPKLLFALYSSGVWFFVCIFCQIYAYLVVLFVVWQYHIKTYATMSVTDELRSICRARMADSSVYKDLPRLAARIVVLGQLSTSATQAASFVAVQ